MLRVSADDNIGVTADGEVVVGRRRSHRADVPRPRQQCPGSPPCPWLGPPWSLVPWSRTVGSAVREGRDCLSRFNLL